MPVEKNVRRPIASEDRYQKTLAKADAVDPTGRLACILPLPVTLAGGSTPSVISARSDVLAVPGRLGPRARGDRP